MNSKKNILLNLLIFLSFSLIYGQQKIFNGKLLNSNDYPELYENFINFDIVEIDIQEILEYVKQNENPNFQFQFQSKFQVDIQLKNNNQITENLIVRNSNGVVDIKEELSNYSFFANNEDNKKHSFVFGKNSFSGTFQKDNDIFTIEPLSKYIPSKKTNKYILYNANNTKLSYLANKSFCATDLSTQASSDEQKEDINFEYSNNDKSNTAHYVRFALVSDYSIYEKFINAYPELPVGLVIVNIIVYNIDILQFTNIFANPSGNFSLQMLPSLFYISDCPSSNCEPYSNLGSNYSRYDKFTNWAITGGLTGNYEIGSLLTTQNVSIQNPSALGVAIIAGFCSPYSSFIAIKDRSINTNNFPPLELSKIMAHEYGHLFNAVHDNTSSSCLMNAYLNSNTNFCWSQESLNVINSYIQGLPNSCFTPLNNPLTIQPEETLDFYPNPISNKLTLESSEVIKEWKILDYTGILKIGEKLNSNLKIVTIENLNNLPKGLYLLSISFANGKKANKIVIKD